MILKRHQAPMRKEVYQRKISLRDAGRSIRRRILGGDVIIISEDFSEDCGDAFGD